MSVHTDTHAMCLRYLDSVSAQVLKRACSFFAAVVLYTATMFDPDDQSRHKGILPVTSIIQICAKSVQAVVDGTEYSCQQTQDTYWAHELVESSCLPSYQYICEQTCN